jgi:hypothetical protein
VKRTTVHIFERGQFVDAMSVCRFLKQHGVDAVVVTKHAIQVHPDDVVKAAGYCRHTSGDGIGRRRSVRPELEPLRSE